MKVSYKHSESVYWKLAMKCWYPLNNIKGIRIRIMVTLTIELSSKYQMQDWIYYLVVQSKSRRFIENIIWKSTKEELEKYSNSKYKFDTLSRRYWIL